MICTIRMEYRGLDDMHDVQGRDRDKKAANNTGVNEPGTSLIRVHSRYSRAKTFIFFLYPSSNPFAHFQNESS